MKKLEKKNPSFRFALLLMVGIIRMITVGMMKFDASLTLMFLIAWLLVVPAGMYLGYSNKEIEGFAYDVGKGAFQSNIIILSVGALIGALFLDINGNRNFVGNSRNGWICHDGYW